MIFNKLIDRIFCIFILSAVSARCAVRYEARHFILACIEFMLVTFSKAVEHGTWKHGSGDPNGGTRGGKTSGIRGELGKLGDTTWGLVDKTLGEWAKQSLNGCT